MWSIEQREKAVNAHFLGGWTYGQISEQMGIGYETIKTWCRRFKAANGVPPVPAENIKIQKSYKPREKSPDAIRDKRIAKLEMEVELLRNFLLADERGREQT